MKLVSIQILTEGERSREWGKEREINKRIKRVFRWIKKVDRREKVSGKHIQLRKQNIQTLDLHVDVSFLARMERKLQLWFTISLGLSYLCLSGRCSPILVGGGRGEAYEDDSKKGWTSSIIFTLRCILYFT
jgi:hypothetical protein